MLGGHLIRTYSKTQATIAKSSGESELCALVRASAEGLGICTLLSGFGMDVATASDHVFPRSCDMLENLIAKDDVEGAHEAAVLRGHFEQIADQLLVDGMGRRPSCAEDIGPHVLADGVLR